MPLDRKDREIVRKRKVLESKISGLQTEFESVEEELNKVYLEEELRRDIMDKTRRDMMQKRREAIDREEIKPVKKSSKKK
jgi:circadian clock protein KaiC